MKCGMYFSVLRGGGGGVQGEFFGRINIKLWATPNPYYMGAGNSHMAQMVLEGQMGHQTVLLITQIHSI